MKKSIKTLVIMTMVLTLILGSIAAASAVPYYDLDTGKVYTAEMLKPGNPAREELRGLAPDKIGINIEGKSYSYNNLVDKLAEVFGIGGIEEIRNFFADTENLEEFEVEVPDDELKVLEISAIDAITVEFGGELELPEAVTATLDNEEATEVTLAIEWAENEEFDAEAAGDYEFTGTLSAVEGEELEFTIPEELATVTVKVTVEEEVVEALRVESVGAIDKTVKLNVAALEPEEGAKAKVVMYKLDEEGEKAATAFKTVAAADIEENIVTVDLSSNTVGDADYAFVVTVGDNEEEVTATLEFKAVEKLVVDVKAANKAKLATLLADETYFTGFVAANVDDYHIKVAAATLKTVADIQELVIDEANEEAEAGSHFADFKDAVGEADTEYEKYLVLKEFYKHVDDENADKYMADAGAIFTLLAVTAADDEAVQDAIDQINLDEVVNANVAIDDNAKPSKLNDYKAALEALEMENKTLVNGGKTKAQLIEDIEDKLGDIAEARVTADEAIEDAEEAMDAYEAAMGDNFDATTGAYEAVVDAIEALEKDDLSVNELAVAALNGVVTTLEGLTEDETIVEDALAAIARFEEVYAGSADIKDDNTYDALMKIVYGNSWKTDDPLVQETGLDASSFNTEIDALNDLSEEWELYNAIMAEEEVAEMEELLYGLEVAGYVNLPGVGKTEFAEYVINALEKEATAPADHTALKAKVGTYLGAYKGLISAVATDIETVIGALEAIETAGFIKGYIAKTPAEKSAIAENVLDNMPTGGYKTLAAIIAQM